MDHLESILRYLGCREKPDNSLLEMIQKANMLLTAASSPKSVWKNISFSLTDTGTSLNGSFFSSAALRSYLKGCTKAVIFAFTLGRQIDQLIYKYQYTQVSLIPVLQACASVLCEEEGKKALQPICQYAGEHNLFLRPSFGPGYDDFPLQAQTFFFQNLPIEKKLGVELTETYMMIPSKTVTSIIGLSPTPCNSLDHKCSRCSFQTCPYRKEPYHDKNSSQ